MTGSAECAQETETLTEAAKKMRDLDVGALPICGEEPASRNDHGP